MEKFKNKLSYHVCMDAEIILEQLGLGKNEAKTYL